MKTTPFLALIALLIAGTAQAQAQAPQPESEYFLSKATLTVNNGMVMMVWPPKPIGRFSGDSLSFELIPGNGTAGKTWHRMNHTTVMQNPHTTEVLSLAKVSTAPVQNSFNSLKYYRNNGLQLRIAYVGSLVPNAWHIAGATLALEFRDKNNNLHPQHGITTVKFNTNNTRIGFNAGDDILSAAKHKDTAYLSTGANFAPKPIKLATN